MTTLLDRHRFTPRGWVSLMTGLLHTEITPTEVIYAGALPLGEAIYEPVGQVRYVAPTGGLDSSPGTKTLPWATIQHAIDNTPTNGTIVLRGGVHYTGSMTAPHGKVLRIQCEPGEEVWLDGTTVISGWTQEGPDLWRAPYNIKHDRFDTTGFPSAGGGRGTLRNHPDQVWVDDERLVQVADKTLPGVGEFSVDQDAGVLTIGASPTNKTVRAVLHNTCLVSSCRIDLLGIGIRRYSPHAIQFGNSAVYFGGTSHGTIVENCHFKHSHLANLFFTKSDSRATWNTVEDGGYSGFFATTADRVLIERNIFRRLNREFWGGAPELAAVKVARCDQPTLRWNWVEDIPEGGGMWYDVSNIRTKMYGNYIDGRDKGHGIMGALLFQEISDGGFLNGIQYRNYCVGNYAIGGSTGLNSVQSSYTEWWNNTVVAAGQCMAIKQDSNGNKGEQANNRTAEVAPWSPYHVFVYNNDLDQNPPNDITLRAGIRASDVRPADYKTPPFMPTLGWDMIERLEGNWLRPGPGSGVNMVELGRENGSRSSFNSEVALIASPAIVGGPPGEKLGPNYYSTTPPTRAQELAVAKPVTGVVATLLGVAEGTRLIGSNPDNLPTPR